MTQRNMTICSALFFGLEEEVVTYLLREVIRGFDKASVGAFTKLTRMVCGEREGREGGVFFDWQE